MRKTVGFVLLALGAALLAVGVVTTAWAPGVVKKTPVDVNTTTRLEGTGARLDAETGELAAPRPVRVTSVSQVDSDASTDADAVFVSYQCINYTDEGETPDCISDPDDPRTFSIPEPDRFATDRVSGEAVNDAEGLPADAVPHEGLVNKFPFDTEQRTYPVWDGLTQRAWDAEFVGVEDLEGVQTYHFRMTVPRTDVDEIAEDTPGSYANTVDIWVEPTTGSIQRQAQDQQRWLADGTQAVDLKVDFTDEQLARSAADAEDSVASLQLVTRTMPLVGFIGGALLLLAGAALVLTARRKPGAGEPTPSEPREPVSV
ncbi:DUF3068 domain-containing protein [Nocardioides litoris]|uniref:DUF3068 domain-containing protein n=1 Tax=Nocardioides litoris TaxID=1926648 RepID=UPI00147686B2|nr:DUF3068 domain-containing protein [Nocardioides litoris]